MGVKFKGLHNVLPYRPPSDLSTLVQQIDRAGRDYEFSVEMILYKNHNGHFKKKTTAFLYWLNQRISTEETIFVKHITLIQIFLTLA